MSEWVECAKEFPPAPGPDDGDFSKMSWHIVVIDDIEEMRHFEMKVPGMAVAAFTEDGWRCNDPYGNFIVIHPSRWVKEESL